MSNNIDKILFGELSYYLGIWQKRNYIRGFSVFLYKIMSYVTKCLQEGQNF